MTIPIRPGPWSFLASLGEAAGRFGEARIEQQQQNRAQAMQGIMGLAELAKLGFADPSAFASPDVAAQAGAAGIPVPVGGFNPVPSVPALAARAQAGAIADPATDPATRAKLTGMPTPMELSADNLAKIKADLQTGILTDASLPALRQAFGIPANAVAANTEASATAAAALGADPQVQTVADAAVLGAGGDVNKARAMLDKDPQAQALRTGGQLQDRHLALAAFKHKQWLEEAKEKYLRNSREARLAKLNEQEQLATMIRANQAQQESIRKSMEDLDPSMLDALFAQSQEVDPKTNQPSPLAVQAQTKLARYTSLQSQYDILVGDNKKLNTIFQTKYGVDLAVPGGTTTPQGSGTPAPSDKKGPARKPGESDADFWERTKQAGLSPAEATAWVQGNK